MRVGALSVIALGLLAACGSNTEERAATGAGSGALIGGLAGGPVGLAIGAAAGGTAGAVEPKGLDEQAGVVLGKVKGDRTAGSGASARSDRTQSPSGATATAGSDGTRQAQQALQTQGYYKGKIDGVAGPQTRRAIMAYQQREGLPRTGRLDQPTMQRLNVASTGGTGRTGGTMSGSSTGGAASGTGTTGTDATTGTTSGGTTGAGTPPRQ